MVSLPKPSPIMLTAIRGTYENGQITWHETPPVQERTEVIVTFLEATVESERIGKGVRLGSWAGKYKLPDNFNEPLDDLADYM